MYADISMCCSHRRETTTLQLQKLSLWIEQGKLNPRRQITMKELLESNAVHGVKEGGVKLLGNVGLLCFIVLQWHAKPLIFYTAYNCRTCQAASARHCRCKSIKDCYRRHRTSWRQDRLSILQQTWLESPTQATHLVSLALHCSNQVKCTERKSLRFHSLQKGRALPKQA